MSGAPRRAAGDGSDAAAGEPHDATRSRAPSDASIAATLNELLRRTYLTAPPDLAVAIAEQARPFGAHDVVLYLIDYEQRMLVPLGDPRREDLKPLSVAGTIAGRAFRSTSVLRSSSQEGNGERLWLPLLDGTERLGVIKMAFDDGPIPERTAIVCERYAHLTAMLIATKAAYGDTFEVTRRRQPMTIASELLWQLAPPLVFATDRLVLAGMLEPCYDNGGDALDYAVNDGVLHVGIFDAMGHGLAAAGAAAFALSAYRHSRRRGCGRTEIAPGQHAELSDQRTLIERLQTAMRCRDDEDLALDRIDATRNHTPSHLEPVQSPAERAIAPPSVLELQAELTQLCARVGQYPEHLVDQLHAARNAQGEAQRVADSARARIGELDQPALGKLGRRRAADSAERALQRQRLKLAEGEIAAAAERERNLTSSLPDRTEWEAEHQALRERAAELNAQLSSRRREHLRVALEQPAPYLTEALGALPEQPRARRTWQQAATRIDAYRFDHNVTDDRHALGPPPSDRPGRAHWQHAHDDLQRAQRDLEHHNARRHSHEV